MAMIEKESSNPLHVQVSDYVRERIYSQEWGVNERIPSEHELMKILGVSRGTIQKGIKSLVDEGLLVQSRGKGTFVSRPVIQHPTGSSLLSYAESLRLQGIDFKTKVLTQKVIKANTACSERLNVEVGAPVLFLQRVRYNEDGPILFMESRVNIDACPGIENYDYGDVTLFSTVESCSNKKIGYSRVCYAARVAGEQRAQILKCDNRAPLLSVDQVIYLENNVAVEWGNMWLPANKNVITSVQQRM